MMASTAYWRSTFGTETELGVSEGNDYLVMIGELTIG